MKVIRNPPMGAAIETGERTSVWPPGTTPCPADLIVTDLLLTGWSLVRIRPGEPN
jgi:hypothetical protein